MQHLHVMRPRGPHQVIDLREGAPPPVIVGPGPSRTPPHDNEGIAIFNDGAGATDTSNSDHGTPKTDANKNKAVPIFLLSKLTTLLNAKCKEEAKARDDADFEKQPEKEDQRQEEQRNSTNDKTSSEDEKYHTTTDFVEHPQANNRAPMDASAAVNAFDKMRESAQSIIASSSSAKPIGALIHITELRNSTSTDKALSFKDVDLSFLDQNSAHVEQTLTELEWRDQGWGNHKGKVLLRANGSPELYLLSPGMARHRLRTQHALLTPPSTNRNYLDDRDFPEGDNYDDDDDDDDNPDWNDNIDFSDFDDEENDDEENDDAGADDGELDRQGTETTDHDDSEVYTEQERGEQDTGGQRNDDAEDDDSEQNSQQTDSTDNHDNEVDTGGERETQADEEEQSNEVEHVVTTAVSAQPSSSPKHPPVELLFRVGGGGGHSLHIRQGTVLLLTRDANNAAELFWTLRAAKTKLTDAYRDSNSEHPTEEKSDSNGNSSDNQLLRLSSQRLPLELLWTVATYAAEPLSQQQLLALGRHLFPGRFATAENPVYVLAEKS